MSLVSRPGFIHKNYLHLSVVLVDRHRVVVDLAHHFVSMDHLVGPYHVLVVSDVRVTLLSVLVMLPVLVAMLHPAAKYPVVVICVVAVICYVVEIVAVEIFGRVMLVVAIHHVVEIDRNHLDVGSHLENDLLVVVAMRLVVENDHHALVDHRDQIDQNHVVVVNFDERVHGSVVPMLGPEIDFVGAKTVDQENGGRGKRVGHLARDQVIRLDHPIVRRGDTPLWPLVLPFLFGAFLAPLLPVFVPLPPVLLQPGFGFLL